MVKSELIECLAERADITLAKAEEIVDLFFNTITETLCAGNRVEIRGFGAFTVREYKTYTGRNPKTGEKITVPPKRLPFWKTGQELKQRVDSAFLSRERDRG
jgi:integration host factor subunit beta